jgi:hypothetical protein
MIAAAFVSIRNLPLAVIATVIPLARHSASKLDAEPEPPRVSRLREAVFSASAIALLIASGLLSPTLRSGIPMPAGAVAFMKQHRLNGSILSDFGWGEYLIWHMAPAGSVFIDGR